MKRLIKNILLPVLISAIAVVLCSCNVFDVFSVDSLIRAPKLTGSYSLIQDAFENSVGADISLVNPLMGDYRSAYILIDFDADNDEDAVVFYALKSSPDEVHMHLLECIDDEWYSVGDIAGNGSEVYKVEFINLDRDAQLEFAVSWSLSDSKRSKSLALYKLIEKDEKNIQSIAVVQISDYIVLDIDTDGQNEIFYTYCSIKDNFYFYNAAVIKIDFDKYVPVPVTDVVLSRDIEQILSIKTDIKDASYSFFIDCQSRENSYFTEILYYDYSSNALIRPQNRDGKYLSELTYRFDNIFCSDYNSDYMIEIPVQYIYDGSFTENSSSQEKSSLYYTAYFQLSENTLKLIDEYYINQDIGFKIKIDTLRTKTYIVYNTDTGSTQFRLKDCKETDDLLFSVSANDNQNSDNDYFVGVTDLGSKFGFTQQSILNLIQDF